MLLFSVLYNSKLNIFGLWTSYLKISPWSLGYCDLQKWRYKSADVTSIHSLQPYKPFINCTIYCYPTFISTQITIKRFWLYRTERFCYQSLLNIWISLYFADFLPWGKQRIICFALLLLLIWSSSQLKLFQMRDWAWGCGTLQPWRTRTYSCWCSVCFWTKTNVWSSYVNMFLPALSLSLLM